MPNDPLDLWPPGLQLDPLTPLKVLQLQARALESKTHALLTAEVVTQKQGDGGSFQVTHRFEVVAPLLNGFRYQLFSCSHDSQLVYPVFIDDWGAHGLAATEATAPTQTDFTAVVRKLLSSKRTLGIITSLLARIGDPEATATPA